MTILPWKLDAVYCASLKVGAPQVALAASLRELLIACESRLISADSRRGRWRRCRMAGGAGGRALEALASGVVTAASCRAKAISSARP